MFMRHALGVLGQVVGYTDIGEGLLGWWLPHRPEPKRPSCPTVMLVWLRPEE